MKTALTRKIVYNNRGVRPVAFWEICAYDERGERLFQRQYNAEMQEGFLRARLLDQTGFDLNDAARLPDDEPGK